MKSKAIKYKEECTHSGARHDSAHWKDARAAKMPTDTASTSGKVRSQVPEQIFTETMKILSKVLRMKNLLRLGLEASRLCG